MDNPQDPLWLQLLYALPLLMLWPLMLRLVRLPSADDARWNTRVDLGLALGLGTMTAGLKAWVLVPPNQINEITGSDIPEVCTTVVNMFTGDTANLPRHPLGALPALLLSPHLGMLDGILAGSLLATAIMGAGIYLWARALLNREAGVVAVLLSCAVAQLAFMPRFFSFYPVTASCYVLCAAGATVALRWPGKVSLALAGAGIGLALLADHAGLIYATPMVALCLGLTYCRGDKKQTAARLAALILPICLSWAVGHLTTPPGMPSFEDKLSVYENTYYAAPQAREPRDKPVDELTTMERIRVWAGNVHERTPHGGITPGFRWGHSGPLQLTKTFTLLALEGAESRPRSHNQTFLEESFNIKQGLLLPWLPLAIFGLLGTLAALARIRWRLLGALIISSPFVALFFNHYKTEVYSRYLLGPLTLLPVIIAVALVTLGQRKGRTDQLSRRYPRLAGVARLVLAGGTAAALILGLVPNWLSPDAPWRQASVKINHGIKETRKVAILRLKDPTIPYPPSDQEGECTRAFERDLRQGIPVRSRIYPKVFSGDTGDLQPSDYYPKLQP